MSQLIKIWKEKSENKNRAVFRVSGVIVWDFIEKIYIFKKKMVKFTILSYHYQQNEWKFGKIKLTVFFQIVI